MAGNWVPDVMERARRCLPGFLLAAVLGASGCTTCRFDLGPIATRDSTLDGNERLRAAGSVFERQASQDGWAFAAARPLYSRVTDPERKRRLQEFAWPLGTLKDLEDRRTWRFLTAHGWDFDTQDADSRSSYAVLPFVFGGRGGEGERYFALFPLGGTLHDFLGRDRATFVLFPLFMRSSVMDVKTTSILWPLISRSEGGDVSRFRVLPFYGRSVNRDRWTKQFVLWPFWNSVRYDYPGTEGGGFVLFPLFGRVCSAQQSTWMVLPPLFRWTHAGEERRFFCPWPFVQYSRGEVDKLYVWPLWGKKSLDAVHTAFLLWPIFRWERIERPREVVKRFYAMPFVTYGRRGSEEDATARHVKLWPLLSYRREGRQSRFETLALWPAQDVGPIRRNLSPFWTLFSRTRHEDASEEELLWGLVRHRRDAESARFSLFPLFSTSRSGAGEGSREFSLLCGLFGYERTGLRKRFRLLYFPSTKP